MMSDDSVLIGSLCGKASAQGDETRVPVEVLLKSALEDWWVKAGLSLSLRQLDEAAEGVRRFFSAATGNSS